MLPPTAPAIQAMRAHEVDVAAARAAGRSSSELPHIMFPAFGPPPLDEGEVGGGVKSPKGKGKMPPGKPSGSPPGQNNPWGSIGDRRGFGGGRDGGASGGGVYF
jgi:hypothetical protein